MEGMPVEDFKAKAETEGHSIFWDYTPEGGEDVEQVRLRAKKFFEVKTESTHLLQATMPIQQSSMGYAYDYGG